MTRFSDSLSNVGKIDGKTSTLSFIILSKYKLDSVNGRYRASRIFDVENSETCPPFSFMFQTRTPFDFCVVIADKVINIRPSPNLSLPFE